MINGRQRLYVFLEFLVFGFILGTIEDIIAVLWSTGEPFSWKILVIVALVTIPFAAVAEFIVNKTKILPRRNKTGADHVAIFMKFFIFGFAMGLAEDLLAVLLATGHAITWYVIGICALVALPFAVFGQLVVNKIRPTVRHRRKKLALEKTNKTKK